MKAIFALTKYISYQEIMKNDQRVFFLYIPFLYIISYNCTVVFLLWTIKLFLSFEINMPEKVFQALNHRTLSSFSDILMGFLYINTVNCLFFDRNYPLNHFKPMGLYMQFTVTTHWSGSCGRAVKASFSWAKCSEFEPSLGGDLSVLISIP